MSKSLLVIGEPGTGKSRAMLNLDPESTAVISPNNKELPFRGSASRFNKEKQNYFKVTSFEGVKRVIEGINAKMPNVKCIVIEDITHYFSERVMRDAKIKSYDKWTDLAVDTFNALIKVESDLRDDLWLIVIGHTTTSTDVQGNQIITLQTPGEWLARTYLIAGISLEYCVLHKLSNKSNIVKIAIIGQSAAKIPIKGIRFNDYLEREYWRNLGNGRNFYINKKFNICFIRLYNTNA